MCFGVHRLLPSPTVLLLFRIFPPRLPSIHPFIPCDIPVYPSCDLIGIDYTVSVCGNPQLRIAGPRVAIPTAVVRPPTPGLPPLLSRAIMLGLR